MTQGARHGIGHIAARIALAVVAWVAVIGLLVVIGVDGGFVSITAMIVVALAAGFAAVTAAVIDGLRGERENAPSFGELWLKSWAGWAIALFIPPALLFGIVMAINASSPLAVPRYVMSNGHKTVVFQGMTHIGSPSFYGTVVSDMQNASDKGYVLFFEGVSEGTSANEERFYKTLGLLSSDLGAQYDAIARFLGFEMQSKQFDAIERRVETQPDHYVLADVSTDDMMAEWDRIVAADPSLSMPDESLTAIASQDATAQIAAMNRTSAAMTPPQRWLVSQAGKALFNVMLRDDTAGDAAYEAAGQRGRIASAFMDRVVIGYRNRKLADVIVASPAENIYVTYGAAHALGVFEMLKAADPDWRIVETTWVHSLE